jgi:hypothetical protein
MSPNRPSVNRSFRGSCFGSHRVPVRFALRSPSHYYFASLFLGHCRMFCGQMLGSAIVSRAPTGTQIDASFIKSTSYMLYISYQTVHVLHSIYTAKFEEQEKNKEGCQKNKKNSSHFNHCSHSMVLISFFCIFLHVLQLVTINSYKPKFLNLICRALVCSLNAANKTLCYCPMETAFLMTTMAMYHLKVHLPHRITWRYYQLQQQRVVASSRHYCARSVKNQLQLQWTVVGSNGNQLGSNVGWGRKSDKNQGS